MPLFAALVMVATVASAGPDARPSGARGVEIASARVEATILQPAKVRQASGHETGNDGPAPQITRRAREVLVEFQ